MPVERATAPNRARVVAVALSSRDDGARGDGRDAETRDGVDDGLKCVDADAVVDALERALRRRRSARAVDGIARDGVDGSIAVEVAANAREGVEVGEDYGAFWLSARRDAGARAAREGRLIERAVEAMFEACDGLDVGEFEVSATCVGCGTSERAGTVDLLEDGEETSGELGTTVARVESAEEGAAAFESAMQRADTVFREGGVAVDRHVVFTLRLKLWGEDAEGGGDAREPTLTRVHFAFLASYVPAPGIIGGRDAQDRAARIECTRSMTALVAVLRSLNSYDGEAFRQVKVWRESPLTRLMWSCAMFDLRRATLYVLCENVLCHAVEGDENSPLELPPATEGALKCALQLKEPQDEREPAPRTRNPPAPTPPKSKPPSRVVKQMSLERGNRLSRTEATTSQRQPMDDLRRAALYDDAAEPEKRDSKVTPEQVDAIVRVIRSNVQGLTGKRMEATIRSLMTEWSRMSQAYETILADFSAIEEQLTVSQNREDEAIEYAEQVSSDLAVVSRLCETLEAEKADVPVRIERAAKDAERAANARALELERRVKQLELELIRNSVPEMEKTRDEAERAARDALAKQQEEQALRVSTQKAHEAEIVAHRVLKDEMASLQRSIEDIQRARVADRGEIDRLREELRARYEVEGELRERITASQNAHETAARVAREAAVEREEQLNDMRRQRDDALHKVHLKEEEVVEARASARASALNAEASQSALSEAKGAQDKLRDEMDALKLLNSDLIVQVKHAKRELEETSLALNKLTEKLEELEVGSEDEIRRRREADEEIHQLKQMVADLEARNKSLDMDREVAYQAADVARTEHAKITASVMDLTDEVSRLRSSLVAAQESTRVLLEEEANRLKQLAPSPSMDEYVTPAWLRDTSWQQTRSPVTASTITSSS